MKNISRWILLLALLLAVPPAHADGSTATAFQSSGSLNGGSVHVGLSHRLAGQSWSANVTSLESMNLAITNSAIKLRKTAPQTYDEADGLSTQFVSQRHSNWIAWAPRPQAVTVTAPEPSFLLMLGVGLISVGFFTQRKLGNLLSSRNLV